MKMRVHKHRRWRHLDDPKINRLFMDDRFLGYAGRLKYPAMEAPKKHQGRNLTFRMVLPEINVDNFRKAME